MPCGVDTVGVRCECVYMSFVLTWFRAAAVRPGSARPYGRTSPALEYPAARAARTRRSGGTRNKYGVRGNHSRMWVAGTSGLALGGPFAIAHPIARYARRLALFSCTQSLHRESKSSICFFDFASYDLSIYFQIPRESHPIRSRRVSRSASRDSRRARGGGANGGRDT